MTDHVHEWVKGDISTARCFQVGWVCKALSCDTFLTDTQAEAMLNEHPKLKRVQDYVEERWKESPESEKAEGYTILKNADVIALLADTQEDDDVQPTS